MEGTASLVKQSRPVTIITGASSGIGKALALLEAKTATVVLVARSVEVLETLANDICQAGGTAFVFSADLSDSTAPQKLADWLVAEGLYCNVLINNAGYGLIGAAAVLDAKEQLGIVDLNVRALSALTLLFLPDMLERGRGGILNVASVAAFAPGPGLAMYYASKAFVLSWSQALWQEARAKGVVVSALCPGPVETAFFARATGGGRKPRLFRMLPSTSTEDVAAAGLRGFRAGKRVIFPSFMNRIAVWMMHITPKTLLLPIISKLQSARSKQ